MRSTILARDRLSDVWRSGRMGGRQGAPRHAARDRGERATTEIRSGGVPVAALIHDPALAEAPVMTEVAHGFAQMALQNQRLEAELRPRWPR